METCCEHLPYLSEMRCREKNCVSHLLKHTPCFTPSMCLSLLPFELLCFYLKFSPLCMFLMLSDSRTHIYKPPFILFVFREAAQLLLVCEGNIRGLLDYLTAESRKKQPPYFYIQTKVVAMST